MTLLFSCSRFTPPSSEDGNKKVPFVCLFVAVLTIRKKDKTQRQKKTWKKSSISPFSSSNCPRFAPSCTETSQAPVVVWDCEMQIQTAGKVRRNIQVLWKQPDLVNFVKFSPNCKIWPMLLNKVKIVRSGQCCEIWPEKDCWHQETSIFGREWSEFCLWRGQTNVSAPTNKPRKNCFSPKKRSIPYTCD